MTAQSNQPKPVVKLLLEGDSSTGKTTALLSLIAAGYKLHILDYDNKLASLHAFKDHYLPNHSFESVPLRDRLRASPTGPILDGAPKAFSAGLDLLDKWPDGSKPCDWGQEHILIVDSLKTMTEAAYNWAKLMAGALSYVEGVNVKGGPDPRNLIYTTQRATINVLQLLTGEWFNTNVIVLSHIKYFDREDGKTKSYPVTMGSAIAPEVPTSFSCVAQLETENVGGNPTRVIKTTSTPMIDLQNPKPFLMPRFIPVPDLSRDAKGLEQSGLAHFFSIILNKI